MYARVVRFTDIDMERINRISKQIEEGEEEGPPEGVDSTGFKLLVDEGQGTAIFMGLFETAEKMNDASKIFDAMDVSETPGKRASVDLCEVKLDQDA